MENLKLEKYLMEYLEKEKYRNIRDVFMKHDIMKKIKVTELVYR